MPYGPERYKDIVKERYYIAKHGRISYGDTGKMSPQERLLILNFIFEDLQAKQNIIDQQIAKSKGS